MSLKASKITTFSLAALFAVSLLMLGLVLTPPPAEASGSCSTQGATKWTVIGCCSCNVLNKRLWACDGATWQPTSHTQCFWGECCDRTKPCCV